MVIYLELVTYMIRLKICKNLQVRLKDENIKEYYYMIHDWASVILNDKRDGYKSKTYKTIQQWKDFAKAVQESIPDID